MTTIDQTTLPVRFEDGSIFLATLKDVPGGVARVLFVNAEIRAAAHRLLTAAQAMAEATATRSSFYKSGNHPLRSSQNTRDAQAAADAAENRSVSLYYLAKGESEWSNGFVDVQDWRAMLQFFNQPLNVGSIKA